MTHLVWFRQDLRITDNPALWHACQNPDEPVLAVAYDCRQQWQRHGLGARRIAMHHNALIALRNDLHKLNIPLLVFPADNYFACNRSLQRILIQMNIRTLSFNDEYEINEQQRDQEIVRWCRHQKIHVKRYHDQCIIPPGQLLNKQSQPYKVFTPFKKEWLKQYPAFARTPYPVPNIRAPHPEVEQLASLMADIPPLPESHDPLWTASEDAAHNALTTFCEDLMEHYHFQRDIPELYATSRLSPYLALGIISPRQCLQQAILHNQGLLSGGNEGADSWINELIWREFYRHLLFAFPDLCKHKAFKPATENIPWRNDKRDFDAWCNGQTGYPIIDAAMRQLKQEGWMHNRLRMLTAMFLTKHLLIDWRWGEAYFNKWLVDADLASNNGGWQWSASTGADGVPYFRIFNPITQSQKFDPQGTFILHYVPELAALPNRDIHWPSLSQRQLCKYPEPIVEHNFARQRAIETYQQHL